MKFLSFLTAFTGRNTPWFLPFNLLLTTLAKSQSSKNNFIWRFLLPSCRRCFKENFLRERLRYVFIICQFYFSNLFILLGKSVIKNGKKTWLNRYIYSAKKHAQWHKCFAIMPLTVRSLVVGNFKRHLVKHIKTGTACNLVWDGYLLVSSSVVVRTKHGPGVHGQGAKKIIFTACHLGKLKLAFTSPGVISTSPKSFLTSRIDFTVLLWFELLKKHHLPVGQGKNRIH